jgi:hypothetical protein
VGNIIGGSADARVPAVFGRHTAAGGIGVMGSSEQGIAVRADAKKDTALFATSDTGIGVDARSNTNMGLYASSGQGIAVRAEAKKDTAVYATSDTGIGVDARSNTNMGLYASSGQGIAVRAEAKKDTAVYATSDTGYAVHAFSEHDIGIVAQGAKYAGYFDGDIMVTGDVKLQNGDCAEEFDVVAAEEVGPGTVVVLDNEGNVRQSTEAYDRRVAGVVSGAGNLRPGIVLGRRPGASFRLPVALVGKVFCRVDADMSPIQVGDLLTTSSTPGHAMKASEPAKAFGAVIGKALRPLESGRDIIPILVALQ